VKSQRRGGKDRPLYMISVAAELAGMHPQTLRVYERKRLVQPRRSAGNTRLYSDADIERLRLIQRLTKEEGINLAGVTRIISLQHQIEELEAELEVAKAEASRKDVLLAAEIQRVRASMRADIVHVPTGRIVRRER